MPVVAGRVVHQDIEAAAELVPQRLDRQAHRRDIPQIDPLETHNGAGRLPGEQDLGRGLVQIEKADMAALGREMLDDAGADAGGAAGHQHPPPGEAGVSRELRHVDPFRRGR